jgi:hypothetical protein
LPRRQLHFLGSSGIQLCRPTAGNYPRIPGVTPGLRLVHDPRQPPFCRSALRVASSPLAARSGDRVCGYLSRFRGGHTRERRCSARKTGGVGGHRGRPYGKAPPPAGQLPPPRQQRCGGTIDGPMPFAFANPLPLPTCRPAARCCRRAGMSWASHVAAGHASDAPVTGGRTPGLWARAGVIIPAS